MGEENKVADKIKKYFDSREIVCVENYSILVDGFRFIDSHAKLLAAKNHKPNVVYFLSHFHSDHYAGIAKSWCQGTIYCSEPTGALLGHEFHIHKSGFYVLEVGKLYYFSETDGKLSFVKDDPSYTGTDRSNKLVKEEDNSAFIEGYFSVKTLPANHCPGAVMFLFRSKSFGTILHTGDFRYNRIAKKDWAAEVDRLNLSFSSRSTPPFYENFILDHLSEVRNRVDVLFLDNTFCDRRFIFPTQWEVNTQVIDTLVNMLTSSEHKTNSKRQTSDAPSEKVITQEIQHVAVLIGTYTIGKEKVALSIQDAFKTDPQLEKEERSSSGPELVPIYVSEEKYERIQSMGFYPQRFKKMDASLAHLEGTFVKLPSKNTSNPEKSLNNKKNVSRNLFGNNEEENSSNEHVGKEESWEPKYKLSIFLVPFGTVTYPSLSKASKSTSHGHVKKFSDTDLGLVDNDQGASLRNNDNRYDVGSDPSLRQYPFDITSHPFTKILAIEPTGWRKKTHFSYVSNTIQLLSIPYSEHCNFDEMVDFVRVVNPKKIIPTVSTELYAENESIFADKARNLRVVMGDTQPLNRFFEIKRIKKEEEKVNSTSSQSANDCLTETAPALKDLAKQKGTARKSTDSPNFKRRKEVKRTLKSFFNQLKVEDKAVEHSTKLSMEAKVVDVDVESEAFDSATSTLVRDVTIISSDDEDN